MTQLPDVERAQRIELGPDDVVIITVPNRLTAQDARQLTHRARHDLGTNRVLVLGRGAQIHVANMPADIDWDDPQWGGRVHVSHNGSEVPDRHDNDQRAEQ